jgi:hypothetical protein
MKKHKFVPKYPDCDDYFLIVGTFWLILAIIITISGLIAKLINIENGDDAMWGLMCVGFAQLFIGLAKIIVEIRESREAIIQEIKKPIIIVVTNNSDNDKQFENIYQN